MKDLLSSLVGIERVQILVNLSQDSPSACVYIDRVYRDFEKVFYCLVFMEAKRLRYILKDLIA